MKLNKIAISIVLAVNLANNANALYVSDLMARDLDIPFYGVIGHVGLATAYDVNAPANLVLEAMNDPKAIQLNSIGSFIDAPHKYWGDKQIFNHKSPKKYIAANTIVRQYYACPSYTLKASWEVGELKKGSTIPISCGVWRCDTLVNYAYYKAGYTLPNYGSWATWPMDTWVNARYQPNFKSQSETQNSSNFLDINKEFIKYKNSPPSRVIKKYWYEAEFADLENKRIIYNYIVESYKYLDLDEIYSRYDSEKNYRIKLEILRGLEYLYQHSQLKEKDKPGFIKFLHKILDSSKYEYINAICIRALTSLDNKNINILNINKSMPIIDSIVLKINASINNPSKQKEYTLSAIKELEKSDYSLDETATYTLLVDLFKQEGIHMLKPESKQLWLQFINRHGFDKSKYIISHDYNVSILRNYLISNSEEELKIANDDLINSADIESQKILRSIVIE